MATKTISSNLEAGQQLAALKKDRESFSDVINRVAKKADIMTFAGVLCEESARKLKQHIRLTRELQAKADRKRLARLKRMFK